MMLTSKLSHFQLFPICKWKIPVISPTVVLLMNQESFISQSMTVYSKIIMILFQTKIKKWPLLL